MSRRHAPGPDEVDQPPGEDPDADEPEAPVLVKDDAGKSTVFRGSLERSYRVGAAFFLLSGFFSGKAALSNVCFAIGCAVTVLALLRRPRMHRIIAWPAAFLTFVFASALFVDSLPDWRTFNGLGERLGNFFTGEGRIFASFTPLLLAAIVRPTSRSVDFLVRCFRLVAWSGVIMITIGQFPPLRGELYRGRTGHLFAFASSHHVSGFLFAMAALVLLTTHRGNRRVNVFLGVAMLAAVAFTGSRTSIVGLVLAGIIALVMRASSRLSRTWLRRMRITLVVGGLALITLGPALGLEIFKPEVIQSGVDRFSSGDRPVGGEFNPRDANVVKRFALWGSATDAFLSSPIVGIGAFRFNDESETNSGVEGLVYFVSDGRRSHDVSTAHNSYIHVAAETGLVGLFLLLGMWFALGRQLIRQRAWPGAGPELRADADSAILVLGLAFGAALTSAALITPGLGVPALLYVGTIALRGDVPDAPPREIEPSTA